LGSGDGGPLGRSGRPCPGSPGYEAEPALNAKDLAVPELLSGPFTVDPKVPVKDFLARFTIRSPYGTFEAHGLHTLAVNQLARYTEGVEPITQVSAPGPILGYTQSGALVVPMPVDYISWTERVARFPQREDIKAAPQHVGFISGRLSPLALKNFSALSWKTFESFSIAAER
jgi:hypothetical protein